VGQYINLNRNDNVTMTFMKSERLLIDMIQEAYFKTYRYPTKNMIAKSLTTKKLKVI